MQKRTITCNYTLQSFLEPKIQCIKHHDHSKTSFRDVQQKVKTLIFRPQHGLYEKGELETNS